MSTTRHLLFLSLVIAAAYAIKEGDELVAPPGCRTGIDTPDIENEPFNQTAREGNLERFCQNRALNIRREHFWCGGYADTDPEDKEGFINETAYINIPTEENFWTMFLQYPALSWMDVARKRQVMRIIREVAGNGTVDGCGGIGIYENFCVASVDTYDVAEYSESVLIQIYNLGVSGETFDRCFRNRMDNAGNDDNIVRFRSRPAFRLTLNEDLMDMFTMNIGPASSIGDEDSDPTLRPIVLGSWPERVNLDDARDDTSDNAFGSNPDPINYGLEAGDIVFAFFGSVLLVILGAIVVLGFFIHPFFLA